MVNTPSAQCRGRSGEMLTLGNLPVATLKCSALPSPQTSSVCLPRPLCHLCMGTPSAASKAQVSGTGTCVLKLMSIESMMPSYHLFLCHPLLL